MMYDLPDEQRPQPTARMLDQWVRDAQDITSGASKRIGWMLASTVVIATLQRALAPDRHPLFLLKGGLYLELQLGLKARTTKDVDTLFRGSVAEFEQAIDEVLAEPWDPFTFERTALERIMKAPRLIKPYRFDVKLIVRGKTWRRIQVEVSFPEGRAGAYTLPIPSPSVGFFGVDSPNKIIGIAMDYQIAQKFHAATDPDIQPDIINDRVRDLIDLILIKENLYSNNPTQPSLKFACTDVFNSRAEEAHSMGLIPRYWPPTIIANNTWRKAYPDLAKSVEITYSLEEAIVVVQTWIEMIDNSDDG